MPTILRKALHEPTGILAVLWPLILLVPFAPVLPRIAGLPWRQELALSVLLVATLALLLRKVLRSNSAVATVFERKDVLLVLPLILFTLWSAASTLWAASTFPALHHTLVWGAYILFFISIRGAAGNPRLLRSSIILLAAVIWILAIACAVEYWGAPNDIPVRTDSLFRYFNGFGEMMAASVPIFAALALRIRRTRAAVFCGSTAVVAWLSTFLALERAPIIGATVGLLLLAGVSIGCRRFRPRSFARALVLAFAFASVVAIQFIPSPLNEGRVSAVTRLQSSSTTEANTRVRFLFWGIGLEMLRENPLLGVGANNYDTAYPEARARFSAKHAGSDLIAMDEEMLVERAHNEYVQILAELGIVGFALFIAFCVGLMLAAWRVLRRATSPLALGSVCSLAVFALSSGASSASFRWMGGGLVFFFAAAVVAHFGRKPASSPQSRIEFSPGFVRTATASACIFSILMLIGRGAQATNAYYQQSTAAAATAQEVDKRFRLALHWNPMDAPTHFNYGMWLYLEKRPERAVTHLQYAVDRGYNASVCYAYLAAAQAGAGQLAAAEQTLERAVQVYPRSVFLRVRHASALAEINRLDDAAKEYAVAIAMDSRIARAWRQLISFGRKAAKTAAFYDKSIAMPGELYPENCIFAVLDEQEQRKPVAVVPESSPLSAAIRYLAVSNSASWK